MATIGTAGVSGGTWDCALPQDDYPNGGVAAMTLNGPVQNAKILVYVKFTGVPVNSYPFSPEFVYDTTLTLTASLP